MCAKMLACPLCSQPGFSSFDALRTALISVATRALSCPMCDEVLIGIDKLTIHLFGHTIDSNNITTHSIYYSETTNNNATSSDKYKSINETVQHSSHRCKIQSLEDNNILNIENKNANVKDNSSENIYKSMNETEICTNFLDQTPSSKHIDEYPQIRIQDNVQLKEFQHTWIENLSLDAQSHISSEVTSSNDSIHHKDVVNRQSIELLNPDESKLKINPMKNTDNGKQNINQASSSNLKLKTNEKSEQCDTCGFHFPNHNILILHKQLIHNNDGNDSEVMTKVLKNHPCHLCSKIFKMRGSLMVHMRVAHTGYNFGNLLKNKDESLATSNEDGYNCPVCGKKFKKEQHVVQHLKTHDGKQWECDVCSKMFTTKYFLKKHKRLHSGEMPYKCDICDKTFTFQQSYHKHRLYHKDDKPHTCTTCGRSFKELSTLHNHKRIHTGEKPFACETCGKCFRQRVSYLVHRRIHTGAMPYKCLICGKNFRYKVSQRTHKCQVQLETSSQQSDDLIQKLEQQSKNEKNDHVPTMNLIQQCDFDLDKSHTLVKNLSISHYNTDNEKHSKQDKDIHKFPYASWSPKTISNEDKLNTGNENDFLSIVMSAVESGLSLPSLEMQHLRVSSPERKLNVIESYDNLIYSSNLQSMVSNPVIAENTSPENNINSLETINEESFRQLLYGINRK